MTTTGVDVPTRRQAADLLETERLAFTALVSQLRGTDWQQPTSSAGWSVKGLVAHVAGQFEELTRLRTLVRRLRLAKRRYPDRIALDGHNQVQIDELGQKSEEALVAHLQRFGPRGVAAVRRMPGFVRNLSSGMFFPDPPLPDRRLAYMFDVLCTRDTWMHRLEICTATGRAFGPLPHDAAVVERVVQDLAHDWAGEPFELVLTGAAGGNWLVGDLAENAPVRRRSTADAIAAMLHLSGRGGLDLPDDDPLGPARVVF